MQQITDTQFSEQLTSLLRVPHGNAVNAFAVVRDGHWDAQYFEKLIQDLEEIRLDSPVQLTIEAQRAVTFFLALAFYKKDYWGFAKDSHEYLALNKLINSLVSTLGY